MINTMLVLLTGGSTDAGVCGAAAAIGRQLQAHLECFHPRFHAGEIAVNMPHAGFAMGPAVAEMLAEIDEEANRRADTARECFIELCRSERITVARTPRSGLFSAGWLDRPAGPLDAVISAARYRDVIVAARSRSNLGLPSDFLERLVLESGRPVLVAPDRSPCREPRTVMVWWKEGPQAARALAAAMPLLIRANRVIVTAAKEHARTPGDLSELVGELCLHGIHAEANVLPEEPGPITHRLLAVAEEKAADLVVLGAYSHSHARESVFGGVTQAVLGSADLPVLLVH
jgi:nucleotide-binding universal stress UspA family protein